MLITLEVTEDRRRLQLPLFDGPCITFYWYVVIIGLPRFLRDGS